MWWTTDGQVLLTALTDATNTAYAAAMTAQRDKAQLVLTDWQDEVTQGRGFMTAAQISAGQSWPAQLKAATTPDQLASLAVTWQQQLDTVRTEVVAAQQQAEIQTDVANAGGASALISQAGTALTTAGNDNLDPGDISDLATQLQSQESSGADPTQTAGLLYTALQQFNQLVSLNDQLNGEMRPLMLLADQASAEDTPNSASPQAQYQQVDQGFLADTTYDQMSTLQVQVTGIRGSGRRPMRPRCGWGVGQGDHPQSQPPGGGLLRQRLRRRRQPDHHRPARPEHPDGELRSLLQDLALHDGLPLATGVTRLVSDHRGAVGPGVR